MNNDPMVTVAHMREAKLCARGGRRVAERYALNFQEFITKGLPASKLEATGDAMLLQLARMARDEAADGEHPAGAAA